MTANAAAAALGTVTYFFAGAGVGPYAITAGPDGNLWFTDASSSRIGRITPTGAVTLFSAGITPGSEPLGIAPGPDGALWFTEAGADQIGRITPSGEVSEFSIGITPGCEPVWIAAGSDGALWFTEAWADQIGRITPSGEVSEFAVGITPQSEPYGIAAGPDGNLWFAEDSANQIGRITPSGEISEFPVGAGFGTVQIAAGPDGNLWFTKESGQVGRITTTGQVTEFSTGISPKSVPWGIAAGPDGNLWFAEYLGSQIGRITPAGEVTEFPTGSNPRTAPLDIVAGPDGNIWFTEWGGSDRIGRFSLELGPPPIVTKASPRRGAAAGGTSVALTGTGFLNATGVKFGSTSAADFTVNSATSITAVSPAGTAGTVDLTVTTPNGTSMITSKDRFKYGRPTVVMVTPSLGSAHGGTTVMITGTGFDPGATGTSFKFGKALATTVECMSTTSCVVTTPAGKSGHVDVVAKVNGETSPKNVNDRFTYN